MTSQPPLPTHSIAPYVVAAVVVLAGIGGLTLWKTSSSPAVTVRPTQPVAVATSGYATEALPAVEVPAPPPPADEPAPPTASAVASPRKGAAPAVAAAAAPCAGACTGSTTPALEGQLAGLGRTARRCYDQALKTNPELKGRIMVAVRVGSSGQVCSANIASNGTGDAELGSCVAQKYRAAQLSAPQRGCVEVQVPLNFVPDNAR